MDAVGTRASEEKGASATLLERRYGGVLEGQQDRRVSSQREEGKLCGGMGHPPLQNILNWYERDCPAAEAAAVVTSGQLRWLI